MIVLTAETLQEKSICSLTEAREFLKKEKDGFFVSLDEAEFHFYLGMGNSFIAKDLKNNDLLHGKEAEDKFNFLFK